MQEEPDEPLFKVVLRLESMSWCCESAATCMLVVRRSQQVFPAAWENSGAKWIDGE